MIMIWGVLVIKGRQLFENFFFHENYKMQIYHVAVIIFFTIKFISINKNKILRIMYYIVNNTRRTVSIIFQALVVLCFDWWWLICSNFDLIDIANHKYSLDRTSKKKYFILPFFLVPKWYILRYF